MSGLSTPMDISVFYRSGTGSYLTLPYRQKFLRDVIFAKNLKTGFSRLFVRESTPAIHKYPGILA